MTVLAGVDAGGSHTEAAITTVETDQVTRYRGDPAVIAPGDVQNAAKQIQKTLQAAHERSGCDAIDILVIGAAGAGDPDTRETLHRFLREQATAKTIRIIADSQLHLEAAFPNRAGMVLVAGTGSMALARDSKGDLHRVGGHGFRFGDEGGAYDIGRAGIQAVLQAIESRGRETLLTDLLMLETNAHDHHAFALWTRRVARSTVADLASLVMLADQAGDPVAHDIITYAASSLVTHAHALLDVLGDQTPVPLALSGGLLANPTPLRRRTVRQILLTIPHVDLHRDRIDPVIGALSVARRLLAEPGPHQA